MLSEKYTLNYQTLLFSVVVASNELNVIIIHCWYMGPLPVPPAP